MVDNLEADGQATGDQLESAGSNGADERIEANETESAAAANEVSAVKLNVDQVIAERYKVKRLLARGGMGSVYQVEQIFLRKDFALKTLNPENITEDAWKRFQKEARAASLLDHQSLIKVHDFGMIDEKQAFFVMDYFEGNTLAQLVKQEPLSIELGLHVFLQVCFGLGYAHSQHVIHRDIKPSNIMLSPFERGKGLPEVKIVDFGIAKMVNMEEADTLSLTRTGEIFGTPYYMSPEQCLGTKLDHRSDIYSLGCVMFESLTGLPPCIGDTALTIMMKHQSEAPPTLREASLGKEFPEELEQIIAKMIAKKPEHRYQNLFDVARDLNRFKMGKKVLVQSTSTEKLVESGKSQAVVSSNYIKRTTAILAALLLGMICFVAGRLSVPETKVVTPVVPTVDNDVEHEKQPVFEHHTSSGSGQFYSEILPGNERVFHFPDRGIGTLINVSKVMRLVQKPYIIPNGGMIDAQGEIKAKNFEPMCFLPNQYSSEHPAVLSHFRSDEISIVDMRENPYAKDDLLKAVASCPKVYSVDMSGSEGVTDRGLSYLSQMPSLTCLGAGECKVTAKALANMKRLPALKRLRLEKVKGDVRELLRALSTTTDLEQLSLRECDLNNDDVRLIAQIESLRQLDISANEHVTDPGMEYLSHMPNLEELSMSGCHMTPASIKYLNQMPHLRQYALHFDQWKPFEMDRLRKEMQLKGVELLSHHIHYSDI